MLISQLDEQRTDTPKQSPDSNILNCILCSSKSAISTQAVRCTQPINILSATVHTPTQKKRYMQTATLAFKKSLNVAMFFVDQSYHNKLHFCLLGITMKAYIVAKRFEQAAKHQLKFQSKKVLGKDDS